MPRLRLIGRSACRNGAAVARAIAVVFSLALAPGSAGAQPISTTQDLSPEQRATIQAQFDDAFQKMLANPTDLDTTFKYAELAVVLGDYEAAVSALERMLLFNPKLARVRLELGVLYFRMGSMTAARAYFMRALEGEDVPAEVHARVQAFLDAMDRKVQRHFLSGSVFAGLRWQSNANAGPSSTGVKVGGFAATLDDEFTGTSDKNAFFSGGLRYVYDLKTESNATIEANGLFYWAEQEDVKEVELTLAEGTLGPRIDVAPWDWLIGSLHAYAIVNQIYLEDRRYFWTLGGGASLTRPIGDRVQGILRFEHRRKRYRDITKRPTVTLLDSNENSGSATLQVIPWENGLVSLTGAILDEEARRNFNTNREYIATAAYTHLIPLPGPVPAGPLAINVYYSQVWTRYDAPDPTVDPFTNREDDEWRAGLTLSLPIYADVAAVFQLQRNFNDSNLPNFKFNNTVITGGLSWTF